MKNVLRRRSARDEALERLGTAADRSKLWLAAGAVMWATGNRFMRRAALRGLLSVGLSAALLHGIERALGGRKVGWFPSNHASSATAFAAGVVQEIPELTIPLSVTAAVVGWQRIEGDHHDLVETCTGVAIGGAIAGATAAFWPVAPREPAEVRRSHQGKEAPALRGGEGLTIAINRAAGSAEDSEVRLQQVLPKAELASIDVDDGSELRRFLDGAVDRSDAIGVVGGDGSINCAAQVAIDAGKPLAVIPGGTLNHLARDLGLDSIEDSARAVESGHAISVDVGLIDNRAFLNTASFGSYVELVDAREKLEGKLGKWPAVVIALWNVLRDSEPVQVELDGRPRRVWLAFIGNCRYHPSGFAPSWRERLDDGQLDVRIVDGTSPWARTRLIASVLTGRLGRCRVYSQRLMEELHVRSLQGPIRLARDGETFDGSEEFRVTKGDRPLAIFVPAPDG
ncbi:MAG: diacylglycerol kinase family protein [Actinomycetota bacterium]